MATLKLSDPGHLRHIRDQKDIFYVYYQTRLIHSDGVCSATSLFCFTQR